MAKAAYLLGMVLSAAGIYISYIPYGLYQESIYSFEDENGKKFDHTLTLLVCQTIAHCIFAFVITLALKEPASTMPWKPTWLPGLTFVSAMLCSNMALEYVSYPTQALAKSSKLVPVMIGGLLTKSEHYTLIQYIQVLLVTIGITVFQWKKSGGSKESDYFGLILLVASLVFDGLTGPRQKTISKHTNCTSFQLMLGCNAWALLFVLAGLFSPFGEGMEGFHYIARHSSLCNHVVLFSLCSAMGSGFIFFILKSYGPLRLTLVTTTRKFFTVFASVIMFGHHLTTPQWGGVALVLGGVSMEIFEKLSESSTHITRPSSSSLSSSSSSHPTSTSTSPKKSIDHSNSLSNGNQTVHLTSDSKKNG